MSKHKHKHKHKHKSRQRLVYVATFEILNGDGHIRHHLQPFVFHHFSVAIEFFQKFLGLMDRVGQHKKFPNYKLTTRDINKMLLEGFIDIPQSYKTFWKFKSFCYYRVGCYRCKVHEIV